MTRPVSLGATPRALPALPTDLPRTEIADLLSWAVDYSHQAELDTHAARWEALATVAAADVTAARVLEPHLDALEILRQAGALAGNDPSTHAPALEALEAVDADETSSWGVFAAEGPGLRVVASDSEEGWTLSGEKPWCSLARRLSHALVTAHTSDTTRRLFAVNLRGPGIAAHHGPWVSRGLTDVVSAPVTFTAAAAIPIGDDSWYLDRPGFAWGGIGVAACWWGGAIGIARTLADSFDTREPDQLALAHLGAIDAALDGARTSLVAAARIADGEESTDIPPSIIARRVRAVTVDAVERTLRGVRHALGPAPLTTDRDYARRVADLEIYVRQHHAERDDAALGRAVHEHGVAPW
ncbi:acyl-CoA dehydrogenase [Agromyces atrinae]|nr:acyl-CoA dehydrogenase [Agromyces atrinae]